jgi:hypothetical protein
MKVLMAVASFQDVTGGLWDTNAVKRNNYAYDNQSHKEKGPQLSGLEAK